MKDILVVGGGVVEKEGKILLVQEKKETARKRWTPPVGRIKFDEDILSATIREIKEETGYDVELTNLVGIYEGYKEGKKVIVFAFRTKIVGGELKPKIDEHFDVKWFTKEEIENLREGELREGAKTILKDYFNGKGFDYKDLIKNY